MKLLNVLGLIAIGVIALASGGVMLIGVFAVVSTPIILLAVTIVAFMGISIYGLAHKKKKDVPTRAR